MNGSEDLSAVASWSTELLLLLEHDDLSFEELSSKQPPTHARPARATSPPTTKAASLDSLRVSVERISVAVNRLEDDAAQSFLATELPIAVGRFNRFADFVKRG